MDKNIVCRRIIYRLIDRQIACNAIDIHILDKNIVFRRKKYSLINRQIACNTIDIHILDKNIVFRRIRYKYQIELSCWIMIFCSYLHR